MVSEILRVCPFSTYLPIAYIHLLFTIIAPGIIDSVSEYNNTEIYAELLISASESIWFSASTMPLISETIRSVLIIGICVTIAVCGSFYCTLHDTVRFHNLINNISHGGLVRPKITSSIFLSLGSDKGAETDLGIVYFAVVNLNTEVFK